MHIIPLRDINITKQGFPLKKLFIMYTTTYWSIAYNTIKIEIVTIKYAKFEAHERSTVVEPMIVMFLFALFLFWKWLLKIYQSKQCEHIKISNIIRKNHISVKNQKPTGLGTAAHTLNRKPWLLQCRSSTNTYLISGQQTIINEMWFIWYHGNSVKGQECISREMILKTINE